MKFKKKTLMIKTYFVYFSFFQLLNFITAKNYHVKNKNLIKKLFF